MAPTKKYKDYKTIGQDQDVESEKPSEDSRIRSSTSVANAPFVAPSTAGVTRHVRILAALVVLMGVASIGNLYVKVGQLEARVLDSQEDVGVAGVSFACETNEDCERQFAGSPEGDAGTICETQFGRCFCKNYRCVYADDDSCNNKCKEKDEICNEEGECVKKEDED